MVAQRPAHERGCNALFCPCSPMSSTMDIIGTFVSTCAGGKPSSRWEVERWRLSAWVHADEAEAGRSCRTLRRALGSAICISIIVYRRMEAEDVSGQGARAPNFILIF